MGPSHGPRCPVKDSTIDHTFETRSDDSDKTIHACDLKGNVYRLTKPNPTELAELKAESDEGEQENHSEWLRRRGNRTSSSAQPLYWRLKSRHAFHGQRQSNRRSDTRRKRPWDNRLRPVDMV